MMDNLSCILIPLAVGILCAILGYFWGRQRSPQSRTESIDKERYEKLKEENFHLRQDLDIANIHLKEWEEKSSKEAKGKPSATRSQKKSAQTTGTSDSDPEETRSSAQTIFDSKAASREYGKRVKENDLKIVEGIGPKIEDVLMESGIQTWKQLARMQPEQLKEILSKGGDRFRMHNPESWPLQASMAEQAQWKELAAWQESHKGGKL